MNFNEYIFKVVKDKKWQHSKSGSVALLLFGCDKAPGALQAVAAATVDAAPTIFGDSLSASLASPTSLMASEAVGDTGH